MTHRSLSDIQNELEFALAAKDDDAAVRIIGDVITSILKALPNGQARRLHELNAALGHGGYHLYILLRSAFRRAWRNSQTERLSNAIDGVCLEITRLANTDALQIQLEQANNINDYFWNAVRVYAVKRKDDARVASLAAAKVAAEAQRASMVTYLRETASAWRRVSSTGDPIDKNLDSLAEEIVSKDWTVDDITHQKEMLSRVNTKYLDALDDFDPSVFVREYPELFE